MQGASARASVPHPRGTPPLGTKSLGTLPLGMELSLSLWGLAGAVPSPRDAQSILVDLLTPRGTLLGRTGAGSSLCPLHLPPREVGLHRLHPAGMGWTAKWPQGAAGWRCSLSLPSGE